LGQNRWSIEMVMKPWKSSRHACAGRTSYAGEDHVEAAVDHEGFLESANIHMRERRREEDLRIGIFLEDGMRG
jgi:hypothetical protein